MEAVSLVRVTVAAGVSELGFRPCQIGELELRRVIDRLICSLDLGVGGAAHF